MNENMELWNSVKQPPKEALQPITSGPLAGLTDINPQWRYQTLTEQFGPCGVGWKVETVRQWTEPGPEGQVFAFTNVNIYILVDDQRWSDPVSGTGGAKLVISEDGELRMNDDAYKMAETDAVSNALRKLGFGADVYAGKWTGSKYTTQASEDDAVAEWQKKCRLAARDLMYDEFKLWWTEQKPNIVGALGEARAAQVYGTFRLLLMDIEES